MVPGLTNFFQVETNKNNWVFKDTVCRREDPGSLHEGTRARPVIIHTRGVHHLIVGKGSNDKQKMSHSLLFGTVDCC